MRRLIYFINPISGTRGKERLIELIISKTEAIKIPFEILETNAEAAYGYLEKKIADDQITDVIVCGGDGTVNQIANAIRHLKINIGIIPMGSGNGLALAAGIPKHIEKALDIIFNGHAIRIDAFFINKRFSCMLCGIGFDAVVAHKFARHTKRGLGAYIRLSLKEFARARPYPFTLHINEHSVNSEAYFICVANSNQFGNNVTIAPRASLGDGLIDVVVVRNMSKFKLVFSLLYQIWFGSVERMRERKFKSSGILYFQTEKLQIENPHKALLHIDGDPSETAEKFDIEIVKSAFSLLQPPD